MHAWTWRNKLQERKKENKEQTCVHKVYLLQDLLKLFCDSVTKPHKRSLLLDPKLQLMLHKTEHVSFSRSEKLYNQPKERGLLHTHTDHLQQQQQQDLGNIIIIIPLSNKIGEKKNRINTLHTKFMVPKKALCTQPTFAACCCFVV
jgi:hypothetical protein